MWFTVDPQGAVIAPSEEDSQSFSISGASSEVYKLRAIDAKQRQYWVSRLRREVENCTNQFGSLVRQLYITCVIDHTTHRLGVTTFLIPISEFHSYHLADPIICS